MYLDNLMDLSIQKVFGSNKLITVKITKSLTVNVYPLSINAIDDGVVFMAKEEAEKFLFILLNSNSNNHLWNKFLGEEIALGTDNKSLRLKKCNLIHENSTVVQETFHFTKSLVIGLTNSIGMGDRLGLAMCLFIIQSAANIGLLI